MFGAPKKAPDDDLHLTQLDVELLEYSSTMPRLNLHVHHFLIGADQLITHLNTHC